jgi:hypothetical protein
VRKVSSICSTVCTSLSTLDHAHSLNSLRSKYQPNLHEVEFIISGRLLLDDDSLQPLELGSRHDGNVGVQLLFCIFIVVSLSCESESHSVGQVLDTLSPDGVVEGGIKTDIGGSHSLEGELTDSLDCLWGSLLEGCAKDVFVQVDCVVAGNDLLS